MSQHDPLLPYEPANWVPDSCLSTQRHALLAGIHATPQRHAAVKVKHLLPISGCAFPQHFPQPRTGLVVLGALVPNRLNADFGQLHAPR